MFCILSDGCQHRTTLLLLFGFRNFFDWVTQPLLTMSQRQRCDASVSESPLHIKSVTFELQPAAMGVFQQLCGMTAVALAARQPACDAVQGFQTCAEALGHNGGMWNSVFRRQPHRSSTRRDDDCGLLLTDGRAPTFCKLQGKLAASASEI
jgi:hypothetical protein